jgi:D-aspartate ligase
VTPRTGSLTLQRSRGRPRTARGGPAGAVVLGGDFLGLGVVRSLGRRGVPVCIVDDERSIARFSRYATHAVRVPDLRDEQATTDALLEAGRRLALDGWVLFPTRDEIVAAVARRRDELGGLYRVPIPSWETIRWASDKRNTYALAERLGIPAPRTWYPRTAADLAAIDGDPPYVLKPAIKENFIYSTGDKAWRADSREELALLYARAIEVTGEGEMMVQELIPGDGRYQFGFGAFFKDGESLGSMTARRRRQHPPEFGRATTYAETVDLPVLRERSERLLREIGYYGLVELEYKQHPHTGEYKLLDFNARVWGYHTLGAAAGVDFPALLFDDQLGQPVSRSRTRAGVRWIRLTTDLPTAAVEISAGRLRPAEFARSLVRDVDTEAVFSRDDPMPAAAEMALLPYLIYKRGF